MQDIRKQMLKAGLIDKKAKKRGDQQKRTERRKKGHRALAQEERERQEQREAKDADRRDRDRDREKGREKQRKAREQRFRLRDLVNSGVVREGRRGNRRFYFVTRAGRIPFVLISEELGRDLERGRAAIVETPLTEGREFEIVTRDTAAKLSEHDARAIRFWNVD